MEVPTLLGMAEAGIRQRTDEVETNSSCLHATSTTLGSAGATGGLSGVPALSSTASEGLIRTGLSTGEDWVVTVWLREGSARGGLLRSSASTSCLATGGTVR